jgi:dihydrofolate reductase
MPAFTAIAAMSRNRVIGRAGTIPWHLPEDFRWFKQVTMGHILVMGRKTFESIGRPLPGRQTVVISRSGFLHPGVTTMQTLSASSFAGESRTPFLCGGAQIYREYLSLCDDLYLTLVLREVNGDAFFPSFEGQFIQVGVLRETPDFQVLHYRRTHPALSSPPAI